MTASPMNFATRAVVALDDGLHRLEVVAHHVRDALGVELLPERRRADHVGEEDRDGLPEPVTRLRARQLSAAREAEPRVLGVLLATAGSNPTSADSLIPASARGRELQAFQCSRCSMETVAKTQPFSIRLSREADFLVEDEVRRTGRSRSAVVQDLAEEAAKTRLFPGIAFRGPEPRRPWIVGDRPGRLGDRGAVPRLRRRRRTAPESAPVPLRQSASPRAGLAERYPAEIEQALADNRRPLDEWQLLYPFIGTTSGD